MTKAIVAALLAASSILPGVAGAQDRGDQARAERRAERQADRRADRQNDRPDRGGVDRPQRGDDRGGYQRPDRGAGDGRQDRRGGDGGRIEDRRGDRAEARQDWRDGRAPQRFDGGRYDRDGRVGNRPGYELRGPGYAHAYNPGQRWSNDWRRDRRYDWNSYRAYNREAFRLPRYYAPGGWGYGYRRFGVGVRIGAPLFSRNYWIADPWAYRLPPAYGPYRWVRYFDDALLIDLRTGAVVDAEYGIFW